MRTCRMSRSRAGAVALVMSLAVAACTGGVEPQELGHAGDEDFGAILEDTATQVVLPTYAALLEDAGVLYDRVSALETQADLEAAREAWLDARVHWELSEAFLFGPVADLSLDPALDSWPVDRVQLDQVLGSGLVLTPQSISDNLGGGLKGFHTIEYLLWGVGGTKTVDGLLASPREVEYLVAATGALRNDAEALYLAWAPEGDAFGEAFYLAGKPGGRYFSQRDAMQQLVNGCIDIADEVANGKIADPFDEQDQALVESPFANNSLRDFADNVQSIQRIYEGVDGSQGISAAVAPKDPALDARVRSEIAAAVEAVQAISPDNDPPFRDAILDPAYAPAIEAAQEAIRRVMRTFAQDVTAALFQ